MDKIDLVDRLELFFRQHHLLHAPLLLGLSGGPDSLALFYALLDYQKKYPFLLHIAHVDHGWRLESSKEACQLKTLANQYHLPFHTCRLQPDQLKGNLEMACREARQNFFADICLRYQLEGVLLGHQAGDQTETILKRVLEGSHWSHLSGLKPVTLIKGLKILRPLLQVSKQDLLAYLEQKKVTAFEDSSNQNERFLRARMRQTILPTLTQHFGKNISSSLEKLGKEMEELQIYFERKLMPLLTHVQAGPFGCFLDLQPHLPLDPIEIKYLLKLFCTRHSITVSHVQYQLIAQALLKGCANRKFEKENKTIYVDRYRLFYLNLPLLTEFSQLDIKQNRKAKWQWEIKDNAIKENSSYSCWKDALQGHCRAWLPKGNYQIGDRHQRPINAQAIDKWWTNHAVPAFMRSAFPVIYHQSEIVHEFLTGKSCWKNTFHEEGIEIILRYQT